MTSSCDRAPGHPAATHLTGLEGTYAELFTLRASPYQ